MNVDNKLKAQAIEFLEQKGYRGYARGSLLPEWMAEFHEEINAVNKGSLNSFQQLMDEIDSFTIATFCEANRNPAILHHLHEEVTELIEAIKALETIKIDDFVGLTDYEKKVDDIEEEFADCFILLFNSASNFGLNAEKILRIAGKKLAKNKTRKWGAADALGVIRHIE